MSPDLWLWMVTVLVGLLVLLLVWSCRRDGSKDEETSKSSSSSFQQKENFIRCQVALQTLLSSVLPSLQRAIDTWHLTTAQYMSPCSGIQPNQCPPYKKPSPRHSCQGCVDWVNAIEGAVYPQSAKGSLQWRNANPALFHKNPLEVMKLFDSRISDVNQMYSTLGDFDAASLLMIMAKFAPFHSATKAVHDLVMKVSNIRDSLAHLKLNNNLHLDGLTFETYWKDIMDLVNIIPGLGNAYFTQQTAQGVCSKLTKIKNQPIGPQIQEEALRPLVEDIVLKTMQDELKQGEPLNVPNYQKRLKAVYRTRRRGIGFLPGFPKQFSSDEFFVDLELVKQQKLPTKVQDIPLKTYTDLLHIQDESGTVLNHVIVSGSAGTGKTTLVSRLAYQWATAERDSDLNNTPLTLLKNFQLVFVLDIRRFQPNMNLADAIKDQLLRHVSKYQLEEYLALNADKCLFLFDGYDELSSKEVVLSSDHLCSSYVIVTTRPNKVDVICDKYQGYVQVNVTGFSKASISRFVRTFFGVDNDSQSRELLDIIETTIVCQVLVQFPLLLAMICVVFKDQNYIPDSISSLFTSVIEYLVRQWRARAPGFDSTKSLKDFKTEVDFDNFLLLLGKTSLGGLMDKDSKLIFSEDDFESIDIVQKGYALGLLSNVTRVHGFQSVCDVSFIHKNFQEYCAALYLSSVFESDQVAFRDTVNKMDVSDMEYVLRFCCGLSRKASECIITHISDAKSCPNEYHNAMLKNCCSCVDDTLMTEVNKLLTETEPQRIAIKVLHESEVRHGFSSHVHQVLKPLLSCFVHVADLVRDNEIMKVIGYFINNYPHAENVWLKHVELVGLMGVFGYMLHPDSTIQDSTIKLLSMMPNLTCIFCCDYINKGYRALDDGFHVTFIHEISKLCPHLKSLYFMSMTVDTDTPPKTVIEVLQWGNSLSEFNFGGLTMDDCDMSSVIAHLKMPLYSNFKNISFTNTSLTEPDIELMCEEMIKSCQISENEAPTRLPLIELNLSNNRVGSACGKLAEAMQFMSSLRKLSLSNAKMNEEHFQVLCPALSHLCNLRDLDLSGNTIGGEGDYLECACSKLAEAMKSLTSLEVLDLNYTQLEEMHFQALGPALSHLSNLEYLDLGGNTVGNALQAVLQGINQDKMRHLSLYNTEFSDESIHALSQIELPLLESLSLENSNVGSQGAIALAVSLEQMQKLSELSIGENGIGSEGVIAISSKINTMQDLMELGLQSNNIGTDGVIALAEAFKATDRESVVTFWLCDNAIGPEGVDALSTNLKLNCYF